MVFEHRNRTEKFKIENLHEVGSHVYFSDLLGSKDEKVANPITGSWFRIEKGPESSPPVYEYDEVGIVIEGSITLKDESGQRQTLQAGDTFVVYRGSSIGFSTNEYGIAWKCSTRLMARL